MIIFDTECTFCGTRFRSETKLEHVERLFAHDCAERAFHKAFSAGLPEREQIAEFCANNGGWRRILIDGQCA